MGDYGALFQSHEHSALPQTQTVDSINIKTERTWRSRLSDTLSYGIVISVGLLIGVTCLYSSQNYPGFAAPSHEILDHYIVKESLIEKSKDMLSERLELLSSLGESMTDAAQQAHIEYLPGITFEPNFLQFSGFLDIGDSKRIFYWLVESENDPANDPIVFWTNGGPGCSGLLGFLMEMGPYRVNEKFELIQNPDAWNKIANMVYIEQPAGVGFSYAEDESLYYTGDETAASDNTKLVQEFLATFPHFKKNPLYLTAESYGGHYMPMWASGLVKFNKGVESAADKINFKGFMVGNPFTNLNENTYGMYNTWWGHQLLPWSLYNRYNSECMSYIDTSLEDLYAPHCYVLENLMWSNIDGINPYALDYDNCHLPGEGAFIQQRNQLASYIHGGKYAEFMSQNHENLQSTKTENSLTGDAPSTKNVLQESDSKKKKKDIKDEKAEREGLDYVPCEDDYLSAFLNQADVRDALHVSRDKKWRICSNVLHWNWGDYYNDMVPYYSELITENEGLKIMVYSGDDDSVCGTMGTQKWIFEFAETAGLKKKADWHKWFYHGDVAGYSVQWGEEGNFQFATVHHAGHEVPGYKPGQAFKLFQHYITDEPLESEQHDMPVH